MKLLCWLGFHMWIYGDDRSHVRPLGCSERECCSCPTVASFDDGTWNSWIKVRNYF